LPVSFDMVPRDPSAQDPQGPHPLAKDGDLIVRALRSLQALLERETADRRTLQGQCDDLRAALAAAQLETAEARRDADVQRAAADAAQAHVNDLRKQVDGLRDALAEPPPRPWWWPF
jgi:chromosome segregation ATPase